MPLFKVKENISVGSDLETSKALVKLMKDSEEEYQSGISENYQVGLLPCLGFYFSAENWLNILQTMSDTTFKALRRALPVTKTKVWLNKKCWKVANCVALLLREALQKLFFWNIKKIKNSWTPPSPYLGLSPKFCLFLVLPFTAVVAQFDLLYSLCDSRLIGTRLPTTALERLWRMFEDLILRKYFEDNDFVAAE